ncbi:MAG: electron transfer flavoprotein subunit alpha/FixB family protein [Anaeromyxobacter sp.]|nr:electron transfer flavoprotein subunit alpha/FixB family protein [Anaeromyxobacter sp.]MBL0278280.1 electron transfer flavoprotein subunit alpha/FixB family protein [Anaeromyxobacter sp.]
MANVLVVAEQSGGQLKKSSLNAVGAGQLLCARTGGQLHVALLGHGLGGAPAALAALGVTVHAADHAALAHGLAEAAAPVVVQIARACGATWVGGAATSGGKDLLPRAAALLDAAMATEVLAFAGQGAEVLLRRPMWAGNVVADVALGTAVKAFTIRPTEFAPATPAAAPGEVKVVAVTPGALRTRFVEFTEVKSARPELTEARVVVSGGRGTKGDFKPIEALADLLGAAVGASRAAVDAGWVPNDWQVGQTGKVVAPELYVAAGISGAIQHLAGMKGSKVIVAINKDPEAPVFAVADFGLVGDLFKVLPELEARIKAGT